MKSALSIAAYYRILFVGVLVMFFLTGCSKHADDCSAPDTNEDQASTRAAAGNDGQSAIDEGRPAGTTYRGAEQGDGNTDGDGMAPSAGDNLEFSGEISATRCGQAGIVACAPTGTNNANHLVVSPRLSTGERTTSTTRKRFSVVIAGS